MTLPLNGLRVVELGSSLAGPFGCRILADLGAEVIKVEPPNTGDPSRTWGQGGEDGASAAFDAINKEKRSVVVDFHNPKDVKRLKNLLAQDIDVVIQNLRPGIAERLGIAGKDVLALNSAIVYCDITAYGGEGPMKSLPGYDVLLQAFGGLIDVTGPIDGPPARVGVSVIDISTGMWAAIGVLSALHERSRTSKGGLVEAAMLDTALSLQTLSFAQLESSGVGPKRSGLRGPMVAPNNTYQTASGLLSITVGTDRQFRRLCEVIERPDLAEDARFADNPARVLHEGQLHEALNKALIRKSRADWSCRLNAVDVPNAPVHTLEEAIKHPQTIASGIVQKAPNKLSRLIGSPLKFNGMRPGFRQCAPELGEATKKMLPHIK